MDANKIAERTRKQLEQLSPDKRAKVEAVIARTQTPEYRAREAADRAELDREYRETGRIATISEVLSEADLDSLKEFLGTLRRERESRGLSLSDLAERTGIDKAALSRLENGRQMNPTFFTLARYAHALGKHVTWSLVDSPTDSVASR